MKRKLKKQVEAVVGKVFRKKVRQAVLDHGVDVVAQAKTAVAPDLPGHREMVTLRLGLNIQSESGDVVQFQPGVVQHNNLSDDELLEAFERQVTAAREQVVGYLRRRAERSRPLTASQAREEFFDRELGVVAHADCDPGDETASTLWGDVPMTAQDAATLDSGE